MTKTGLPANMVTNALALLANTSHPILKQAVGSTRKSMSDLSYEVNDDFDPEAKDSPSKSLPLIVFRDINLNQAPG